MSEKIKIAIVIDDEKSNADKKDGVAPSLILTQDASVTLMPVLLKNHLMTGSFCGQRGDCGRCIVQFTEGAPLPTGLERAQLTPKELQQGYRLACVTRPRMDCTIKIAGGNDVETPIVTELNLPSESKIGCYEIFRKARRGLNKKQLLYYCGGFGNDHCCHADAGYGDGRDCGYLL